MRRAVLICLLFTARPPAGAAADSRSAEADRRFYQGDYQQALELYQALASETGNAAYLCNVGRCHDRLGQPKQAVQNMRACLSKANLDRNKRREYEGRIRTLETGQPAPEPPRAEEPAAGTARAEEPAGAARAEEPAAAAAPPRAPEPVAGAPAWFLPQAPAYAYPGGAPNLGAEQPRPIPPPAPPRRSAWPYALGVLGAAGLLAGVGFGLQAQGLADQLGRRYDPQLERKSQIANARQTASYLVAITSFVFAYVSARNARSGY